MEGIPHPIPRTVEEVFSDFRGRRAGLIKALTNDVQKFYQLCDPEKENLCLYGLPNETWEVNLPVEEVPPELPEPALGINFARDGMQEKDWLSLVAVHSDSWLLAVAFYFGARFGFGKNERKRLFQMINDLPTIFEVVTGNAKQPKDQSTPHNSSKNKSSGKGSRQSEHPQSKGVKMSPLPKEEDESGEEEEEDDEQGATCGACGDNYGADEFWICCDVCERWFHGKCVKITPAKAEHIKQYNPNNSGHARLSSPIYAAAGSGLEASIGDAQGNLITLKTAKIVVESQDDNKIQVRVDLTGDDTQKVFDRVLTNLARTAPPVPGFRRQKGGPEKLSVGYTCQPAQHCQISVWFQENLTVKENKVSTTQTAEELKLLFTPGNEFGFNATLELETSELETPS
ncbi:PHD finger protein ALFIN-LIKE 7-like [Pyrus ussuriensis x Pyrus communis]|uniref:PHD finger protein ALFIN-LIKE n=1 Tax=Pyrus ussuriensis x Pyrus communis TaxID=2448454 RepID=A0A5N5HDC4_9ROSA|nr:PHD finger protein ALFIN-LIKE 7-like [Pyrus ussuriensis x Pyrus communis]